MPGMNGRYFAYCSVTLILVGLITTSHGSPVQNGLSDDDRQEIATLAAQILKISMNIYPNGGGSGSKRNAGTVDMLYNIPHLLGVGRRR